MLIANKLITFTYKYRYFTTLVTPQTPSPVNYLFVVSLNTTVKNA